MEDPDDSAEPAPPPPRPWGLTVASVLTSAIGLFRAQNALDSLERSRGEISPDHPLPLWRALLRATWEYEQQHHSLMVSVWAATAVLSGLLFFTSTRVFLKVRDTGALWRQALLANLALTLVTLRVEQRSGPERLSFFRHAIAQSAQHVDPLKGLTLDQCEQVDVAVSMGATWLRSITLMAVVTYAVRARTRALIG